MGLFYNATEHTWGILQYGSHISDVHTNPHVLHLCRIDLIDIVARLHQW